MRRKGELVLLFETSIFIVVHRSHSNEDESEWEFDSVRYSNVDPYNANSGDTYLAPGSSAEQEYEQLTIRAPASTSTFPTSLRMLFEDSAYPASSSYRPTLPKNLPHISPSPGPTEEPPKSPTVPVPLHEGASARNPLITRSTNTDPVQSNRMGRRFDGESKGPVDSPLQRETIQVVDTTNIDMETTMRNIQALPTPKTVLPPSPEAVKTIDQSLSPPKPLATRHRSRSSAGSSERHFRDRDLASPAAFRFPLKANASDRHETEENIPVDTKPTDSIVPSSHQPAHSLDTISRRAALQPSIPPTMHRTRSATAIQPLHTLPTSKAPISLDELAREAQKLPNRIYVDRNGPDASLVSNHPLGTPGLKDVLKASTRYFRI
jgi:hypothetical protein